MELGKLITVKATAADFEVCEATVWNMVRQKRLPPPFKVGPRMVRFSATENERVKAAMAAGASRQEIEALVDDVVAARKEGVAA